MGTNPAELRQQILLNLEQQGFSLDSACLVERREYAKEEIRRIHQQFRVELLEKESGFVAAWYPKLAKYFASGREISPEHINPFCIVVDESESELGRLFRLASLWWSIPVSRGFGRRFRVVVLDQYNGKLIGLLGLTDPVFNLRARDSWIGWDVRAREKRLRHVMDAYVLGAIPPYNQLLGAKLVALISASDFVTRAFRMRYRGKRSIITRRLFDGRLAMVTATSALGRSSIYNRLRFNGDPVFVRAGLTEGYGHFHVANGTFEKLRAYLRSVGNNETEKYQFGQGPNFRIRVARVALEKLGLPSGLLRHGIRREVYVSPLAENAAAFLRGQALRLRWLRRPISDVIGYWRERWMLPRASRDDSYKVFDSRQWLEYLGLE